MAALTIGAGESPMLCVMTSGASQGIKLPSRPRLTMLAYCTAAGMVLRVLHVLM